MSPPKYLIANPIYDAVFKRLLADLDLAREILSLLLGLEIASVRLTSQEVPNKVPVGASSAGGGPLPGTMRMDFCAIVRVAEGGFRQVLIELQKTRISGDILRFRHYLAERYTTLEEVEKEDGSRRAEPLPLICIYLLGFEIDARLPVVTRVERRYVDGVVGTEFAVPASDPVAWIEGLTHNAWFIQIPRIAQEASHGTALERFLSLFDQNRKMPEDPHRLDYRVGDGTLRSDELLRRVVRRLHKLQSDPEMERMMSAEDVFELEQKRIHEDLTRELRRQLAEEQKRREEEQKRREEEQKRREEEQKRREESDRLRMAAELELERLRRLLDEHS